MTRDAGELGQPSTAYDVDWVVAAAQRAHPGLSEETAVLLAQEAWSVIRRTGVLDAPEVARNLIMGEDGAADASAASVVARAAVDFCRSHQVDLS